MKEYFKELQDFLKFIFVFFIPAVIISLLSVFGIVTLLMNLAKITFN